MTPNNCMYNLHFIPTISQISKSSQMIWGFNNLIFWGLQDSK